MTLLFATTIFTSALLLFSVQPLVARLLLPRLGGAPAVWNTCLVFFQGALLLGYAYAHFGPRLLGLRRHAAAHLLLVCAAVAALSFEARLGSPPPASSFPALWLLWTLVLAVGLPTFALSATAPLVQRWFAEGGARGPRNPYFLYAASNAGSLIALAAYPAVVEPLLRLSSQIRVWGALFGVFVALIGACVAASWQHLPARPAGHDAAAKPPGALPALLKAKWVLLAFAPSSLLLGVTGSITTDLAPVPLLWVLPLMLYLLTFVVVFSERPAIPHGWMLRAQPAIVMLLLAATPVVRESRFSLLVLHLLAFFVTAMVCHGELVRVRPEPGRLTEFYLWMSLGGVLGGMFNALAAPSLFSGNPEYLMALVLALLLRPGVGTAAGRFDLLLPGALGIAGAAALALAGTIELPAARPYMKPALFLALGAAALAWQRRPLRFGLAAAAVAALGYWAPPDWYQIVHQERNFFGRIRVGVDRERNMNLLLHGRIIHGAQSRDPAAASEPRTYFSPVGPLGDLFAGMQGHWVNDRLAVIGLGVGSCAAYATAGQRMTFYEIDPAIERVARDSRWFSFLSRSRGAIDVKIGDARLRLQEAPDNTYAMILVDAFSSDVIPVHLLTREAVQLYARKLAPGGILVFNISNNYLNLEPVLAGIAGDIGWGCLVKGFSMSSRTQMVLPSTWAVLARSAADIGSVPLVEGWGMCAPTPGAAVWTDQYSNIFSVLDARRLLQ